MIAFAPYASIGLYPIVDNSDWLKKLLPLGIQTIQLRIKDATSNVEQEIQKSIALAKKYRATLFINDFWELALHHGAPGIHLGQTDLDTADIKAIATTGTLLGISTHTLEELQRALRIQPSYVACGPIYETSSKVMPYPPQGLAGLKRWRAATSLPLVAIGGLGLATLSAVRQAGANGAAFISAITQAPHPINAAKNLLFEWENCSLS